MCLKSLKSNEKKQKNNKSLIVLLPEEERDRHDTLSKAKIIWVEEFSSVVNNWLEKLEECDRAASEIEPSDSVSNIETRVSSRTSRRKGSHHSSRSSKYNSSVQLARI